MGQDKRQDNVFTGIGVSPGIVIGKLHILDRGKIEIPLNIIEESEVENQIERFRKAVRDSISQLRTIKKKVRHKKIKEPQMIIDTYVIILEDDALQKDIESNIRKRKVNAEWALKMTVERYQEVFDGFSDDYLRERKFDLQYIADRVIRNLSQTEYESISQIKEKVIVASHDLSPADTAQMNKQYVLGFVTEAGGKTSHTAIMARALEIPAVVGLENITKKAYEGDVVVLDGYAGVVIINPSPAVFRESLEKQHKYQSFERELSKYRLLPAETREGYRIKLTANLELVAEIPSVIEHGAEGIGLYRTEFLYLNRQNLPDENEHFETYRKVLENIAPHEATIRTLDLGGDKFLHHVQVGEEMNPVMGLRAIRLCLKQPEIFKAQLAGILRASVYGKANIMFPLISGVRELRQAKDLLEETKEELTRKSIPFDPDVRVGIMIEVPSAAEIADLLAKEAEFFSIGTNDLIQYCLGIDRVNEHVAYLYEPFHPSILRTIRNVVEAGHRADIKVSMCGEMAGEPLYVPLLLGLGLDELSMNPLSISRVKRILRGITLKDAKMLIKDIYSFSTALEIKTHVFNWMRERFPDDYGVNSSHIEDANISDS
jgi:phosphotransferase system enzyme I (PtsI)